MLASFVNMPGKCFRERGERVNSLVLVLHFVDSAEHDDAPIGCREFFGHKVAFVHDAETRLVVTIDGIDVPMYDKERMLIELARNKTKLPYDFYKEVLRRYRAQTEDLDIMHLQEYLLHFPKAGKIREILEQEVF